MLLSILRGALPHNFVRKHSITSCPPKSLYHIDKSSVAERHLSLWEPLYQKLTVQMTWLVLLTLNDFAVNRERKFGKRIPNYYDSFQVELSARVYKCIFNCPYWCILVIGTRSCPFYKVYGTFSCTWTDWGLQQTILVADVKKARAVCLQPAVFSTETKLRACLLQVPRFSRSTSEG